jgi:hypothetical protein
VLAAFFNWDGYGWREGFRLLSRLWIGEFLDEGSITGLYFGKHLKLFPLQLLLNAMRNLPHPKLYQGYLLQGGKRNCSQISLWTFVSSCYVHVAAALLQLAVFSLLEIEPVYCLL